MAQLTYKIMTQQIDSIDKYIELVHDIQKECNDDKGRVNKLGGIIDVLLCYKNYLKFDKVYEASGSTTQQRPESGWEIIDRDANGERCYKCPECGISEWRYEAAAFCPYCGADMRKSGVE